MQKTLAKGHLMMHVTDRVSRQRASRVQKVRVLTFSAHVATSFHHSQPHTYEQILRFNGTSSSITWKDVDNDSHGDLTGM